MAVNPYAETRCYHCDDLGHIAKGCRRANLPGKRFYNCIDSTTDHAAANCPVFRRDNHKKPGNSKSYEYSFRRVNKSSGGGNNNNNKRRHENNENDSNSKISKFDNSNRGRGSFEGRGRGGRQKSNDQENKQKSNNKDPK